MKTHVVRVDEGIIVVDVNLIADFTGRNKNTVRGWKNSKGAPVYETDDRGVNYFDLFKFIDWKKININEKFNHNRDKTIDIESEDDFKLELPHNLKIAEIDLNNSIHLSILAAHPMGQFIRDTLEFRAKQLEKEKDIEKKSFEMQVRKREFLKTEELKQILAETTAMVLDADINTRSRFPVEISEVLLNASIIDKKEKENTQSLIIGAIDEINNEKYKLMKSQFMKRLKGKTKQSSIKFLEELIEQIKEEEND